MLLAVSIGFWAFFIHASAKKSWTLLFITLALAILFYWWRFSLFIERENDPNFDCTFFLYCFRVS